VNVCDCGIESGVCREKRIKVIGIFRVKFPAEDLFYVLRYFGRIEITITWIVIRTVITVNKTLSFGV
jgi:hypothetical protein